MVRFNPFARSYIAAGARFIIPRHLFAFLSIAPLFICKKLPCFSFSLQCFEKEKGFPLTLLTSSPSSFPCLPPLPLVALPGHTCIKKKGPVWMRQRAGREERNQDIKKSPRLCCTSFPGPISPLFVQSPSKAQHSPSVKEIVDPRSLESCDAIR